METLKTLKAANTLKAGNSAFAATRSMPTQRDKTARQLCTVASSGCPRLFGKDVRPRVTMKLTVLLPNSVCIRAAWHSGMDKHCPRQNNKATRSMDVSSCELSSAESKVSVSQSRVNIIISSAASAIMPSISAVRGVSCSKKVVASLPSSDPGPRSITMRSAVLTTAGNALHMRLNGVA